ncbi:MAG: fused MFS/spermidine synthase, partial [Lachnospiraceae bacterium]
QSLKMKGKDLTGLYYDYALAAPAMAGVAAEASADETKDILILGMGTGTFATQCMKYYPEADITGVEIDQSITDLAHEYFALPEDVNVVTYDGRAYLNADTKKYDVIMVDAYQDITIPFQMSSVEFFTLVKDHLKDNGVMVMNMNMHSIQEEGTQSAPAEDITFYLTDTVASVFPNVKTVNVPGSTNREVFASANVDLQNALEAGMADISDEDLSAQLAKVEKGLMDIERGSRIFTDDKAPVELLGMQTIDTIIRDEVGYYKEVFKEEGLSGLIEVL